MSNYTQKLENLKRRRQDVLTKSLSVTESFRKNEYGNTATYALESMEPIDNNYTQNTYKACEKVKSHLLPGLAEYGIPVDFRYQGSVPTDTHIKLYSDIDLLTIHGNFHTLEPPQVASHPYAGDPLEDLKTLRKMAFRILDTVYSACEIDDTGSKCISISGGSLNRKIDIIPCNWYNALIFQDNPDEANRGIEILDKKANERITNFPFLHIYWINHRDVRVNGNEKRMIRLLKSLKADADQPIDVSSYDISSLVYRMDDHLLQVNAWNRLQLLDNTNAFLLKVLNDAAFRQTLMVPNGTRNIFSYDGAKTTEVAKLQRELQELIVAIRTDLAPLHKGFEGSHLIY